jgi:hypothetical protein
MREEPRILLISRQLSELLMFRRLLRDTPFTVDAVRRASEAIERMSRRAYRAVVVDDDSQDGRFGAELLAEAVARAPQALRILVGRPGSAPPGDEGLHVIERPFVAQPLLALLGAGEPAPSPFDGDDTEPIIRIPDFADDDTDRTLRSEPPGS